MLESSQSHVGSFGFTRTGHVGISRNSNLKMAENYFKGFMKHEKVTLMTETYEGSLSTWVNETEDAEKAICDIEVIQQFASWLCSHARKIVGSESQFLMLGSVKDILSSTRTTFNALFPGNTIFSGSKDQLWYTNLRYKSQQEIVRRDIKVGVASSNKSKPIGRTMIKNIIETLFQINTKQSITKAIYVGTTFNSAGRSGEAAFTCIDTGCYRDLDEEKLYFNQKEMKVGEEKKNSFVSDSEHFMIDQYWLLSTYYMTP